MVDYTKDGNWKTHDEAIDMIIKMFNYTKEEAEDMLEQFKQEVPHGVITVTKQ